MHDKYLHAPSSLCEVEQCVVVDLRLLAFVWWHRKNLSFEPKICEHELLVLLQKFPRLASKR